MVRTTKQAAKEIKRKMTAWRSDKPAYQVWKLRDQDVNKASIL